MGLASIPTLRPFPEQWLIDAAVRYRLVVTCEEHSVLGGLGGAAAEVLSAIETAPRLERIGLPATFPSGIGSQEYMREVNGLDTVTLVNRISRAYLTARP